MSDHNQAVQDMEAEEMRRQHMDVALAGADKVQLRALWTRTEDLRMAKDQDGFSASILELYFTIRDHVFSRAVQNKDGEGAHLEHVDLALGGADISQLRGLWAHGENLRLSKDEEAFGAYVLELYFNIRDYVYDLPKVLLPDLDETCISEVSPVMHGGREEQPNV